MIGEHVRSVRRFRQRPVSIPKSDGKALSVARRPSIRFHGILKTTPRSFAAHELDELTKLTNEAIND